MNNRKAQLTIGILILILGTVLVTIPVVQALPAVKAAAAASILDRFSLAGGFEQELKPGEFISVVDEKSGAVIDKTGHVVYIGDELIDENNEHYRVVKVKGNKAFAKSLGKATDIVWKEEWDTAPVDAQAVQARKPLIAIYHTHSGESYVPTDGKESIPARGGILKVGSAMASKFQNQGVSVLDDKTPHEPHDANAYHRSRRTAVRLLKQRPAAILDIHRDGVPDPDFYSKNLEGKEITRVRIVVGRQNPNMATNLQFAKNVKAYMDKTKPGLIRGIFIGRGDYNQDLSPRALLLEVGTHTNSRYRAQQGAAVFAEAFPSLLNIKTQAQPGPGPGQPNLPDVGGAESRSGWSTLAWILGIVLVGGAAFLFLATGSVKGVRSKLGELGKTEFANYLGLKKAKNKGDFKDNDKDK